MVQLTGEQWSDIESQTEELSDLLNDLTDTFRDKDSEALDLLNIVSRMNEITNHLQAQLEDINA